MDRNQFGELGGGKEARDLIFKPNQDLLLGVLQRMHSQIEIASASLNVNDQQVADEARRLLQRYAEGDFDRSRAPERPKPTVARQIRTPQLTEVVESARSVSAPLASSAQTAEPKTALTEPKTSKLDARPKAPKVTRASQPKPVKPRMVSVDLFVGPEPVTPKAPEPELQDPTVGWAARPIRASSDSRTSEERRLPRRPEIEDDGPAPKLPDLTKF
ncbi:hypothetical protein HY988_03770 [Candidatus Micrarchaeota archaeon]|nr:hypothetical protein [Candidatus Micrarchaeota archaeon]